MWGMQGIWKADASFTIPSLLFIFCFSSFCDGGDDDYVFRFYSYSLIVIGIFIIVLLTCISTVVMSANGALESLPCSSLLPPSAHHGLPCAAATTAAPAPPWRGGAGDGKLLGGVEADLKLRRVWSEKRSKLQTPLVQNHPFDSLCQGSETPKRP